MLTPIKQLKDKFSYYYLEFINSIGFYPAIISFCYLIAAILFLFIDNSGAGRFLTDHFSFLQLKDLNTAQIILSTLIGGIISLTVLSFSMVMIVLTQAANNLSPKLILGLISEKSHQFVLGNYLGSIIFFLTILISLRSLEIYTIPSLSVLFSIILGINCLALFVYFIHSISNSIQVTHITMEIFEQTRDMLKEQIRENSIDTTLNIEAPKENILKVKQTYYTKKSGFLQYVKFDHLVKLAKDNDMTIQMAGVIGNYYIEDTPLFYTSKTLGELDSDVVAKIYKQITFFYGETISNNYVYGFTQLMEVAVKAMSPGINDPGTAIVCVNYLTDLFIQKMKLNEKSYFKDEKGEIRLVVYPVEFNQLFHQCFSPIMQYGGKDIFVASSLLKAMETIARFDLGAQKHKTMLNEFAEGVLQILSQENITIPDKKYINAMLAYMNDSHSEYFNLDLI